jgi:N-carbamoyl-L-amino-acid hydrolase
MHGQHVVEQLAPHRRFCRSCRPGRRAVSATRSPRILAAEADVPTRPLGGQPHAYVEAHIEQGPRLEAAGLDIGVVTGIQGSRWFTVTLTGETAHAGTTPLALRHDAVQDMVRAITALNALMHDPRDVLRFTVDRIVDAPNTSSSVADRVSFTIDYRHPDKAVLLARGDAAAAVRDAGVTVEETFHALPVAFSPLVIDAVERAASDQQCKAALESREPRRPRAIG